VELPSPSILAASIDDHAPGAASCPPAHGMPLHQERCPAAIHNAVENLSGTHPDPVRQLGGQRHAGATYEEACSLFAAEQDVRVAPVETTMFHDLSQLAHTPADTTNLIHHQIRALTTSAHGHCCAARAG
jgi:hypothetical protein